MIACLNKKSIIFWRALATKSSHNYNERAAKWRFFDHKAFMVKRLGELRVSVVAR